MLSRRMARLRHIRSRVALSRALGRLAAADPDLQRAQTLVGTLPDRARDPGFATLLRIIVDQQLSVAAAAAIWKKVEPHAEPETILRARPDRLRALGLSRPKVEHAKTLARAVRTGDLDLDHIAGLPDAEAIDALVKIRGIGRWTAEIYLLFALQRADIWPAQDLALQVALQRLKNLPERPSVKDMDRIAEPWAPDRGVAARLLWRYYAVSKQPATS